MARVEMEVKRAEVDSGGRRKRWKDVGKSESGRDVEKTITGVVVDVGRVRGRNVLDVVWSGKEMWNERQK